MPLVSQRLVCRAKKYSLEDGDWNLIKINPSHEDLLVKLGLGRTGQA